MKRLLVILFVTIININAFGQNTYILGNSAESNSWFKLGVLSLDQQGRDAIIRISGGIGYNASIDQNSETLIHFRTSNGDSNDNGFYGAASFYRTGRGVLINAVRIVQINLNTWEFYANMNWFSGEGAILVCETAQGNWVKDFQKVGNPPSAGVYKDITEEFRMQAASTFNNQVAFPSGIWNNGGNVGLGTTTPQSRLDVNGDIRASQTLLIGKNVQINDEGDHVYISCKGPENRFVFYGNNQWQAITCGALQSSENIQVDGNLKVGGNVGIGVTSPQHKLDVKGTICADEVLVKAVDWADYVFDKNYKLRDLTEVNSFIEENKHLPEVPTASEVKEKGINLVDMQVTLLKKVEEMTLYILAQEKKMKEMQARLDKLESGKEN